MAGHRQTRVLYITGWGRSGSTILGNLLGSAAGAAHVGELCFLWERGLTEDRLCGCGERFNDCPMWRESLTRAFGSVEAASRAGLSESLASFIRTRHLLRSILPDRKRWIRQHLDPIADSLASTYRAVARELAIDVIIDSSKMPIYGYALDLLDDLDVFFVHLVRDPRGVAYSWQRKLFDPGRSQDMRRHGIARCTLAWMLANLGAERLCNSARREGRYRRLRYEDFVNHPRATVRSLLAWIGLEESEGLFEGEHDARLQVNHTASGNPVRFSGGAVRIEPDLRWREETPRSSRLLVETLAAPGMLRYGYRLQS